MADAHRFDEPEIAFDREKFEAVVHWIVADRSLAPDTLGRTKLHKCLYYADMLAYVQNGRPLTGEDYLKQPFGPTARHLKAALDALSASGKIRVSERSYFGLRKFDFESLEAPANNRLSAEEKALLGAVTLFVCGQSANEISELSHAAPWQSLEIGERIPYFTAFWLLPDEGPSEAAIAAAGREAERVFGGNVHR